MNSFQYSTQNSIFVVYMCLTLKNKKKFAGSNKLTYYLPHREKYDQERVTGVAILAVCELRREFYSEN